MSKRNRNQANEDVDNPSKKMKCSSMSGKTPSNFFINDEDEEQFRSIFDAITNSKLIKNNHVIGDIVREIACYATGNVHYCENKQCKQEIIVLVNDFDIYDDNHENAHLVGFKHYILDDLYAIPLAGYTGYFCSTCMDQTVEFWCMHCETISLIHEPTATHCDATICRNRTTVIPQYCCNVAMSGPCYLCNKKYHFDCDYAYDKGDQCLCCKKKVCSKCSVGSDTWDEDYVNGRVCKSCDDKSEYTVQITCHKCNERYIKWHPLLPFASKTRLDRSESKYMTKCREFACELWVCPCEGWRVCAIHQPRD